MSLSELEENFAGYSAGDPTDRMPPQDVHAEQSVLGGMLLSKDAIADCVETLRSVDFYRPAHELIYDAILDLYGRGEPADAITVADELTKRGDLARIGGQAYLHQLIQAVPTAANAGYYAEIVAERATLRRLVDAGTRIVQMGYGQGGGDVEDIVNAAQAEVYAVADKRGGEDYHLLRDLLEPTYDEIEAAGGASGEMIGVPTGFAELDELTNGLHPGQMIVVAARPAVGKALALDTPLPTPTGWTTMGAVRVGDQVLGSGGQPIRVVAATEVMRGRPCYEVVFADGERIVADEQHEWLTEDRSSRRSFQSARDGRNRYRNQRTFAAVRTTGQIAATLRTTTAEARLNHSVALAKALQLPEADLLVPPYTLGAWLGDGTSATATLTCADPGIVVNIEDEGIRVTRVAGELRYRLQWPEEAGLAPRTCVVCGAVFAPRTSHVKTCGRRCGGASRGLGVPSVATCPDCGGRSSGTRRCARCHAHHGTLQASLRTIGVLGRKHIPAAYKRSSECQRRALLAGLLDTDGTVTNSGCVQLTNTSAALANDAYELIVSLGYRCTIRPKRVQGRSEDTSTAYTLTFSSDEDVFGLERKRLLHKDRRSRQFQRRNTRFITAVRPVESVTVRCIQVDSEDHLYLAGRGMTPTHNSTLALDFARAAAIKYNQATVVFSLEMSRSEITMRLISAEAGINLQKIRRGKLEDRDWEKLARLASEFDAAPLFIDDSPNMSLMEIRAKCRRLKQRNNLRLVIIDYLQLMTSGKKVESRQQEVSEFSRALKLLAKELEVPVVALSQLNRGPEQRTDKKPQVSDLRESGCLTAETRLLRADTGAEVSIGELVATGARDVPVWALDSSLRYVPRLLTHAFPTATRPVFRLTTASGRTVRATANHPFLTYQGWTPLGELAVGQQIAVPRHVSAPSEVDVSWEDADVEAAAQVCAGMPDAVVPSAVCALPKRQIAVFLRAFFTAAGGVMLPAQEAGGQIFCFADTRGLLDRVALLLLRFGITGRIVGDDTGWMLDIVDLDCQRRFLQEIGIRGEAEADAVRMLSIVRAATAVPSPVGGGPGGGSGTSVAADAASDSPWGLVAAALADEPSPNGVLAEVAGHLDAGGLDLSAVNDVLWDTVVAMEPAGVEEVYDATVLGAHNFVANGIAVHNSIEQDADMVMLLHRESMYEQDSPREGEADIIVAKHRNGPTKTITVAFQGHYSRFTNMATTY